MAKAKQRQLVAFAANRNNSSNLQVVHLGEDGWMFVKKQKVNILIPPLPVTAVPPVSNPEQPNQSQAPIKSANTESPSPNGTCLQKQHSVCERDNSMSTSPKPLELVHRMTLENPLVYSLCCTSRFSKRSMSSFDGGMLLSRSMRASNIERKLRRAGGLSSWLASMGLYQFVKIFRGKSLSKFQLANMTMKKLKDMGADAVGPRRKLMHAINCLCQPYCFEDSLRAMGK